MPDDWMSPQAEGRARTWLKSMLPWIPLGLILALGVLLALHALSVRVALDRARSEVPRDPQSGIMRGAEPFYLEGGDAACLLVHGFTSTPQEMRALGRFLHGKGFTVQGLLLPGHGRTPQDLNGTTWNDWYDAVAAAEVRLRERHRFVFLIGSSTGAALVLHHAAVSHPDGVVAFSPSLYLKVRVLHVLDTERHGGLLEMLFPYIRKGQPAIKDPAARARHLTYQLFPIAAVRSLLQLSEKVREELPEITAPLLIIQSRADQTVDPESARLLYDTVSSPRKELVWLSRSNHVISVDYEAETVFEETARFLGELVD